MRTVRIGVIGLGRAFTLMLPTFASDRRVSLVAAFDPRPVATARFASDFQARIHSTAEALCADPEVDVVYVASPHQNHREHVELAARSGKHAIVEKPMALTVLDCKAMIEAAHANGVVLMVGHSHSFDLPYLRARELISSGKFGAVRLVTALNFTDFLYRPRRPEELDTAAGGGVVFSQAAHQIDIARLLVGARASSIVAHTGRWDTARPTEGAYTAQIKFENGAIANLTYSGYGHFDTDELVGWRSELGTKRDPNIYGLARRTLATSTNVEAEISLKNARAYGEKGAVSFRPSGEISYNHFGFIVASCEFGDIRPGPQSITIYSDNERQIEDLPVPTIPRSEVIDELYGAVVDSRAPIHSGEWGLATLEACLAVLESAQTGQAVELRHQI